MSNFQKRAEEAAGALKRLQQPDQNYETLCVDWVSRYGMSVLAALRAVAGGQEGWRDRYAAVWLEKSEYGSLSASQKETYRLREFRPVLIIADPTIDSGKEKP